MKENHLKDIEAPNGVEISIRDDGKVIWINVEDRCELRINDVGPITIEDKRKQRPKK